MTYEEMHSIHIGACILLPHIREMYLDNNIEECVEMAIDDSIEILESIKTRNRELVTLNKGEYNDECKRICNTTSNL